MERKTEILRNVGLIAHAGSGKTSLAEAMLFDAKMTTRLGKVDDETSIMDFEPEEIARKITISTAIHHADWKKHVINIIDTPGDDNFLSDTKLSLQAADSVVVVVDATGGVKVGTEKVWSFADELQLPRIIFINKLDRERSNFFKTVEDIANHFEKRITPLFLPIGIEADFSGVVDLVKMKAYTFAKDGSGKFETGDIPADMSDLVEEWREKMIENIVEADDALMEKYLEGEELSAQDIENTLIKGMKNESLIPVVCGSALLNIGVSQLMDLIIHGLPSPQERPPKKANKPIQTSSLNGRHRQMPLFLLSCSRQ